MINDDEMIEAVKDEDETARTSCTPITTDVPNTSNNDNEDSESGSSEDEGVTSVPIKNPANYLEMIGNV